MNEGGRCTLFCVRQEEEEATRQAWPYKDSSLEKNLWVKVVQKSHIYPALSHCGNDRYVLEINYFVFSRWIKLCFNRKSFLKNFAGHLAQLNWGLSALDTAMWLVLRWTSRLEFWVKQSPHRLHLRRETLRSWVILPVVRDWRVTVWETKFWLVILDTMWGVSTWREPCHCCRCRAPRYQQHS